jgi:hypothetical protein
MATSGANVSDVHLLPDLLHSEERKVWGGGYQGQAKAIQQAAQTRWATAQYTRRGRANRAANRIARANR